MYQLETGLKLENMTLAVGGDELITALSAFGYGYERIAGPSQLSYSTLLDSYDCKRLFERLHKQHPSWTKMLVLIHKDVNLPSSVAKKFRLPQ